MKILELELAQLANRRLARESFASRSHYAVRQAIDAYQLIVQAEDTVQLGEQAGLISLRLGYEQALARLYESWLETATTLSHQVAETNDDKLIAKLQHSIAQAENWLEVHDSYRRQFAVAVEADALVLL